MKKQLKMFDDYFINLINSRMKNKYLDIFMYRVTDLGGAIFITMFTLGLVIFGSHENKLIGVEALLSLAISQIIVHSLKRIMSRERPYKIIEHLNTLGLIYQIIHFHQGILLLVFPWQLL